MIVLFLVGLIFLVAGVFITLIMFKLSEKLFPRKQVEIFTNDAVTWRQGDFVRKGKFIRWQGGFAVVHDTHGAVEYITPTLHELTKVES